MGPADKMCQPVRVEPDQGGGYGFELDHVYKRGDANDRRGPIRVLDEAACYWKVTESRTGASRKMTYEAATRQSGGELAFDKFSSLVNVRERLIALFG